MISGIYFIFMAMTEYRTVFDQIGRKVKLPIHPRRIISLVPSQTELLFELGLNEEVVGITRFCVHPKDWFSSKNRVGGTKDFDPDRIHALEPDLIIANKEENDKDRIEMLSDRYPIWVSDVRDLSQALEMIASIGEIVAKKTKALELVNEISAGFQNLPQLNSSVVYLIWKDPIMAVGRDTFIDHILESLALHNCLKGMSGRYPELSLEELKSCSPDYLLLSSEPFPFKDKHIQKFQTELPQSKVILVDGEAFSWYGSKLRYSPDYFRKVF